MRRTGRVTISSGWRGRARCAAALVLLAAVVATRGAQGAELRVEFASLAAGRAAITADDTFTRALSRFDLQSRLQTDRPVTLEEWKAFAAGHVRAWEPEPQAKVEAALARLGPRLKDFRLPLPEPIVLVRTTGGEEGQAAYTRGAAIFLPDKVLAMSDSALDRLLAHELFHLVSRHDAALRAKLYRLIGFEPHEPIELPGALAPRKITNPDSPLIDCSIDLPGEQGRTITAAPVLFASAETYDPRRGGSLFQYLTFRLLVLERVGTRWQPLLVEGQPRLLDPQNDEAYFARIGRNTRYIIHPEEILADNFALLVMGERDVKTPRVLEGLQAVLAH